MEQTEKKSKTINTIVGIVVGIAIMVLVQQVFFKKSSFKKASLDKALMEVASDLNKSCPMMVDKETRCDNAVALLYNIFQYNYTLVNMEKSTVDINGLKKYLEPRLVNNVKTNPDLKIFRVNKITMAYYYNDKNGEFLFKISVTPEQYSN